MNYIKCDRVGCGFEISSTDSNYNENDWGYKDRNDLCPSCIQKFIELEQELKAYSVKARESFFKGE